MRVLISLLLGLSTFALAAEAPEGMDPNKALARLVAGNKRYIAHRELHPDLTIVRRKNLDLHGQHPFAVILGCADSRVPPELIFDQGLGDLFVIRDAGNVVDPEVLGSIEYAVEHLGSRLVIVMGHEKCGAVSAAVQGGEAPGHIKDVIDSILPGIQDAMKEPGDKVHNCVLANVRYMAKQIAESEPILKEMVKSGKIKVVAADYNTTTGKVEILK